MHARITLLVYLPALGAFASGCKGVDCGDGTTERDGICVPSNEAVTTGKCGPFTVLQGDTCVPMFPPTVCDPGTTQPDTDQGTGVTTCIGTGMTSCSAKVPCPAPTDGKQILCGQIYDFETGLPFAAGGATGAQCPATPTASGPCSLGIHAFDAVAFAMNPTGTAPLTAGPVYIDDCGRYKVSGVPLVTGKFVALAFDDAMQGIGGTTNPVGIATDSANQATKDLDAFIVRGAVAAGWGSPPLLAAGVYAAIYRGHRTGTDLAEGVQLTIGPANMPATTVAPSRTFYFGATATTRTTLDATATATGANGTALLSGATLAEDYAGKGGIPATCMWETHAGVAIPGVVFVQTFRPTDIPGMTCPL